MLPFPAAFFAGGPPAVVGVAAASNVDTFRPADYGLRAGDMLVSIGNAGGFGQYAGLRYLFLSQGQLNQTFDTSPSGEIRAYRGVSAIRGVNGGGFTKSAGHAGILLVTEIATQSLEEGPRSVIVAGNAIGSAARWYSPPEQQNVSRNLHTYLYPASPLYPDGGTITVTFKPGFEGDTTIIELIGSGGGSAPSGPPDLTPPPTTTNAILAESGDRLLLEDGGRLLKED